MTASQAVLAIQQEIRRDLAKEQQVTSFVTSSGRAMVLFQFPFRFRVITCQVKFKLPTCEKVREERMRVAETRVRFGDQEELQRGPGEELQRGPREERGRARLVTNPNFTIYKEGGAGFTKYTVYTGQERMVRHRSLPPRDRKRPARAPSVEQFLSDYRASPAGALAALGHTLHPSQVLQLTSSSHYQISVSSDFRVVDPIQPTEQCF